MQKWFLILFTTLCVNVWADDDLLEDLADDLPASDESLLAEPAPPPPAPEAPVQNVEAPKDDPFAPPASDILPDESQTADCKKISSVSHQKKEIES